MKRRHFLGLTAMAAGAAAAQHLSEQIQAEPADSPAKSSAESKSEPVWRQLTKNIQTTRVGFGTGMKGWERQSDLTRLGWNQAIELLRFAYDRGIRLFDCADLYGTHAVVAEALKGKPRSSYVLVSKCWMRSGGLQEQERLDPQITVKRFLRELKTDYIDLVQIHCVMEKDWTKQMSGAMDGLEKLKQQGIIRAHGISSHSNAATELAAETDWCDVVHVRINSEGFNMDGPKDDAAKRVEEGVRAAKKARDAGKGIICMKVLGEGKMSHDAAMRRKSARFVSGLGCADTMIVGFSEKEHITEFLANIAAEDAGTETGGRKS